MAIIHEVHGHELRLLASRAIYWAEQRILLLSDIHLGKVEHFRKWGIALPRRAALDNYARLQDLILSVDIERVMILGDLFHSDLNQDWYRFAEFIQIFSDVSFELVLGNHDIIGIDRFRSVLQQVHEDHVVIDGLLLSHEPMQMDGCYNLSGHIHPGAVVHGRGKQRLRLPCFYFAERYGVLPAFGAFTGLHVLDPKAAEAIYVIAEDEVIAL
ncbi:MAG: ligase-associated DNA damage response endonuclease PdeM [Bacteroidota bacterium]